MGGHCKLEARLLTQEPLECSSADIAVRLAAVVAAADKAACGLPAFRLVDACSTSSTIRYCNKQI